MSTNDVNQNVSLLEVLDRVLNKGAIIAGDLTISVAGIDLLYVGLNVIVTSVETMNREKEQNRSHLS